MINVVIPVWNGSEYTNACLQSIQRNIPAKSDVRVFVVDDASTDSTEELLEYWRELAARKFPLIVERNASNLGFAGSCNRGLMQCMIDDPDGVVIWLNNDTECLDGNSFAIAADRLTNQDVGVVGALLWYPSHGNPKKPGRVQHAGLVFQSKDRMLHAYRGMLPRVAPGILREKYMQAVTGAFFAMRVEDASRLGGFSEDYINGYEDLDLCFRTREILRKQVLYCPEIQLIHHESVSGSKRHERDMQNHAMFMQRWRDKVEVDFDRTLIDDGGVAVRV